ALEGGQRALAALEARASPTGIDPFSLGACLGDMAVEVKRGSIAGLCLGMGVPALMGRADGTRFVDYSARREPTRSRCARSAGIPYGD
ncbi:MAG: hypothetical protein AAFX99_36235, partial [Myxococcota bacterium]